MEWAWTVKYWNSWGNFLFFFICITIAITESLPKITNYYRFCLFSNCTFLDYSAKAFENLS